MTLPQRIGNRGLNTPRNDGLVMASKIENKLLARVKRATKSFTMLEEGDRVMVCMSGGKDSYALLDLLTSLKNVVPFSFSLVAVNLDQGHPGFPKHVLPDYLRERGYEFEIVERDTLSVVKEKLPENSTYCSLCSRLRRGILYDTAQRLGCTKIALGHHRDDVIETLMLNLLYGGKISAMPPKFRSDDGRNVVIRPLLYCPEEWIIEFAKEKEFPIIPCNLCGSQENLHRQKVKALLQTLDDENPFVKRSMMGALANVSPSHLHDEKLWDAFGVRDWNERGVPFVSTEPDPLAEIEGGCGTEPAVDLDRPDLPF